MVAVVYNNEPTHIPMATLIRSLALLFAFAIFIGCTPDTPAEEAAEDAEEQMEESMEALEDSVDMMADTLEAEADTMMEDMDDEM
jgi:hypothetical protein